MKKILLSLIVVLCMAFSSSASVLDSSNSVTSYYNAGENVVEAAPTIFSQSLVNYKVHHTYGYSIEVEHWTSQYMGTGIEIGNENYQATGEGVLGHITILEDFRYVPFSQDKFFSRFAIGWKTGAETTLSNGSKGVEFGGELYWTLSKNLRFEADITQFEETVAASSGQRARFAISWLF